MDRETMVRELEMTLNDIQGQMDFIAQQANSRGLNVRNIIDADGNWVMIPLLTAKAQVLAVLSAFTS